MSEANTPGGNAQSSNKCSICGKEPSGAVLKDPFGKSDVMEPRCGAHMPRLRDPQDVADIEHLTAALVDQENVLNECESLLREALDEDGMDVGFGDRLATYWTKTKPALADWRTRDLKLEQRKRGDETGPVLGREPWRVSLPVITIQMIADYGQEGFFEKTDEAVQGVKGVKWSQAAVDFACMLQGERQSALEKFPTEVPK